MDSETGSIGLVWEISKAASPRALPDLDLIYTEVGNYKGLGKWSQLYSPVALEGAFFFLTRLSQKSSEVTVPVHLKMEGQ